jgi:hypothetical protein
MTIDTKTARIVYRCKKCKVTVARDAEYAIRRWTETKICFGGGRMEYEKSARRYVGEHYDNAPPSAKCPACARTLYGDSVKGTTRRATRSVCLLPDSSVNALAAVTTTQAGTSPSSAACPQQCGQIGGLDMSDLDYLAATTDAIASLVAHKLVTIDHEAASDLALYSTDNPDAVASMCAAPIMEAA